MAISRLTIPQMHAAQDYLIQLVKRGPALHQPLSAQVKLPSSDGCLRLL